MAFTAKAQYDSNVYHGPDPSIYVSVGSIYAEETVMVLGQESEWYYISYSAGDKLRRGFIPVAVIAGTIGLPTAAVVSGGCSKCAVQPLTVYAGPDSSSYASVGSVSAWEPVTAFTREENGYTYIEYGTTSGAKRGYVPSAKLSGEDGVLASMAAKETVYYGPAETYAVSGSIGGGEYCIVLARELPFGVPDNWCQIEYIAGASRKRGYIRQGNVAPLIPVSELPEIPSTQTAAFVQTSTVVYTGPGTLYTVVTTLSADSAIRIVGDKDGQVYSYIEFDTEAGRKRGYVPRTSITEEHATADVTAQATTVYAGPSARIYAPIGNIQAGVRVSVLSKEDGWFLIEYPTSENQMRGYVPIEMLDGGETISASMENRSVAGHLEIMAGTDTVLSGPGGNYDSIGSVSAGEGVTVLDTRLIGYRMIEYSASSGTKRGYVAAGALDGNYRGVLGKVLADAPAYYGASASFIQSGSVYKDEYVVVLDRENSSQYDPLWYYVEFNAASGRKRGYIAKSAVALLGNTELLGSIKKGERIATAAVALNVYSGPGEKYAKVGSVSAGERVSVYAGRAYENAYAYIEYCTASGAKMGYVPTSQLTTVTISIPAPTADVTPVVYGMSATGKHSLRYYRIGTGPHALLMTFAMHGYEDAWAADGLELCKLANQLIDALAQDTQDAWKERWSVYIIPAANPDGITEGYTCNGPGRTVYGTGIDFNRCFPTNFEANFSARNYTGAQSLGAQEAVALQAAILQIQQQAEATCLLDVHGWLNMALGDRTLSAPFCEQFGFGNKSVMSGKGYLSRWAIGMEIPSALIELPYPSSIADIQAKQYFAKLNAAVHAILNADSI